jgi:hypothetical protein
LHLGEPVAATNGSTNCIFALQYGLLALSEAAHMRGIQLVNNASKNSVWGEDVFLHNPVLRRQLHAVTMSVAEVNYLSKRDFDVLITQRPQDGHEIRVGTLWRLLKRASVMIGRWLTPVGRPIPDDCVPMLKLVVSLVMTPLSYTPLIHSLIHLHPSHTLLSYTPLIHPSHTLSHPLHSLSYTLLPCTPLIHSSHTLLPYTPPIPSSSIISAGDVDVAGGAGDDASAYGAGIA